MNRLSNVGEYIRQLNNEHKRHHRKVAWNTVLALFVVFFVIWNLREKGISLTNEVDCGMDEHIHNTECYLTYQVCGIAEGGMTYLEVEDSEAADGVVRVEQIHTHSDNCYEKELVCELTEHIHTVECINLDETENKEVADDDSLSEEQTEDTAGDSELVADGEETEVIGEEDESEDEVETVEQDEIQDENESEDLISDEALWAMHYDTPDAGMLTIQEMINKAYSEHLAEMEKDEDKRDLTKIIKFDEFYVVTATGLRHKNKIREFLEGTTDDMVDYIYEDADGRYIPNGRDNGMPYILYRGAPLQLVVFRSPDVDSYIYTPNNMASEGNPLDTTKERALGANGDGGYQGTINFGDGYSAVYTKVSGGNPGNSGRFRFVGNNGKSDNFYTYVRYDQSQDYHHSDIEIADGGFFKISTTRNFDDDGYYQVVTTKYDSFVSEVNKCRIYFSGNRTGSLLYPGIGTDDPTDPDNAYCGEGKSVYEKINTTGGTQYEITSAYNCFARSEFYYHIEDVDYVEFTVEISLAPSVSIIEKRDKDGTVISTETKDFAKDDGSYDYVVTPLVIKLGKQSIIDALNKCPNHTGMDFNLLYSEVNLNLIQPVEDGFSVKKVMDAPGRNVSDFEFELLDDKGNRIGNTVRPDSSTGIVEFPVQDFPIPGQYKYKIREVIPGGAQPIEQGLFYKNPVVYDGRTIDVVVDVSLNNELLAIVNDSDVEKNTKLVAEVHYYLDGQEINISDEEDLKKLEFHNNVGDYKVKDLRVNKIWADGNDKHINDNITFRIVRKKNNESSQYYSILGKSVFELNNGNSWQMQFNDLPVVVGNDTYSYEVVETAILDYSPYYTKSEDADTISYTIKNIKNVDKYLHFKKIWTDDVGNLTAAPDGIDKVSLKLMREYRELEVPVRVKVQPVGGRENEYSNEFVLRGYVGGTAEFKLETSSGIYQKLSIANYKNCSGCVFDDSTNIYKITGIENGAEVLLQYTPVTSADLTIWSTTGSDFGSEDDYGRWRSSDGAYLNRCWQSYYSNQSNGSQASALAVRGRSYDWSHAYIELDPSEVSGGNEYSFNAYVMYRPESKYWVTVDGKKVERTQEVNEAPTDLVIQLRYNLNGEVRYDNIATASDRIRELEDADGLRPGTWYRIHNEKFMVPEGATNIQLHINTFENKKGARENGYVENGYVDVYFDDVVVAPVGYDVNVVQGTGELKATRLFNQVDGKVSVPNEAFTWTLDPENPVKSFGVTMEKGWTKDIRISELGTKIDGIAEKPNREYRYFVVEEPVPEKYKPIYSNDYVAYNDAENPIVVENRYCAYMLPNTGGIGSNRIRWLGLLVLLLGIPPVMVNFVRKRGGPA